jgi:predicted homoserine dehydrogenase-like protein
VKAAAALAVVVVLAGCGAGAPEQQAAELALARMTNADEARCTTRASVWFRDGEPANVFICAVAVGDGLCDRYRVDRNGLQFRASVLEQRTGCVLPVG